LDNLIRLIIADDHTLVREGLVTLLADVPNLQIVGLAGTGQEAMTLVRQHHPDIALIDISMPQMSGLEATCYCKAEFPELKIIILTMHEEEIFFFEALRAGASGYLLKGASVRELISAIRSVHAGGVYLPPQLAGHLVQAVWHLPPTPLKTPRLTPREREILALVAQGLNNHDIAERLLLSPNTVKTYCLRIYQKLALHNRGEFVTYAQRLGLLQSDSS
jgi:DNA-binding NarL/FixJ family response regulator